MTITLPDGMRDELQAKAKVAGFATVDEFVMQLVLEAADPDAEDLTDMPVPEELVIRDRADLEAKIRDGLNSGPPIRVTPGFWNDIRAREPSSVLRHGENRRHEHRHPTTGSGRHRGGSRRTRSVAGRFS